MFIKDTKFKVYGNTPNTRHIYVLRPISTSDDQNNIAFRTNQGESFITSDGKEFMVEEE